MITIIILGWILHMMGPPTIIWVLYSLLITAWIFAVIVKVINTIAQ